MDTIQATWVQKSMEGAVRTMGEIPADGVIEFPKAWNNKINLDSLTIIITPEGTFQELYVANIHLSLIHI